MGALLITVNRPRDRLSGSRVSRFSSVGGGIDCRGSGLVRLAEIGDWREPLPSAVCTISPETFVSGQAFGAAIAWRVRMRAATLVSGGLASAIGYFA